MVALLRNYEELSPVILSVGEEDEISIADVARLIVKDMGFTGNLVVKIFSYSPILFYLFHYQLDVALPLFPF